MVKKQLKDLLRRHRDFKMLLLASNIDEVNIGNLSFASVSVPQDAAVSFQFSDMVCTLSNRRVCLTTNCNTRMLFFICHVFLVLFIAF